MSTPLHAISGAAFCSLQGTPFALPLEHVRSAMALQERLRPVPQRQGAIAGLIAFGDQSIPVLDLRLWLSWPQTRDPHAGEPGLVVILCHQQRYLAILADSLEGVSRQRHALSPLNHDAGNEEDVLNTTLLRLDGRKEVYPVLDVARLFALCQIWSAAISGDAALRKADAASSCAIAQTETVATFLCGNHYFAINVRNFVAVTPAPALLALSGKTSLLGYITWRSRQVPVLRPQLYGAGPEQSDSPMLAILEHGGIWVAIALSSLHDVRSIDISRLEAVGNSGALQEDMISAALYLEQGDRVMLLNAARLVAACPIATEAAPEHPLAGNYAGLGSREDAYMIVRGAHEWAIPMKEVVRVAMLADNAPWGESTDSSGGPACTYLHHQGRKIPVWDTDNARGRHRTGPLNEGLKVVILRDGESFIGTVFDALIRILPSSACSRVSVPGAARKRRSLLISRQEHDGASKTYAIWDREEHLENCIQHDAVAASD